MAWFHAAPGADGEPGETAGGKSATNIHSADHHIKQHGMQ